VNNHVKKSPFSVSALPYADENGITCLKIVFLMKENRYFFNNAVSHGKTVHDEIEARGKRSIERNIQGKCAFGRYRPVQRRTFPFPEKQRSSPAIDNGRPLGNITPVINNYS
jgi:hypothetical protein